MEEKVCQVDSNKNHIKAEVRTNVERLDKLNQVERDK